MRLILMQNLCHHLLELDAESARAVVVSVPNRYDPFPVFDFKQKCVRLPSSQIGDAMLRSNRALMVARERAKFVICK